MRTQTLLPFTRSSTSWTRAAARSGCVEVSLTLSFVSVISAVDTPCANADTSRTSSGVHLENTRRISVVYSSNSISHRRYCCSRRRVRVRVRSRARAAFGEVTPFTDFISTNVSAVASRARSSSASSESLNVRVSASRRRSFAVVSPVGLVDGSVSPVSSRSRARVRIVVVVVSVVIDRAPRPLSTRRKDNHRSRASPNARGAFCRRRRRHLEVRRSVLDFKTTTHESSSRETSTTFFKTHHRF